MTEIGLLAVTDTEPPDDVHATSATAAAWARRWRRRRSPPRWRRPRPVQALPRRRHMADHVTETREAPDQGVSVAQVSMTVNGTPGARR